MKIRLVKPARVRVTYEVKHHIREWRTHRNLSVEKLGELAGVSGSMISQLERGKTTYTQSTLEKLATALRCSAWQLLASGPVENQRLWEHVLQAAVPNIDLDAMDPEQREKLQVMLSNNCDAAVKSARTVLQLIEVQSANQEAVSNA
jgi:transcriptional regulator with XRE-family HTH domain